MTDHSKPRKVLISCWYALSLMMMTLTWAAAGAAETASLRVDLSQGAITSLENLLTGETYTRQVEAAGVESTLRYMAPGPNLREVRAGEEGASLEAQVTTEGTDLLVQQLGERAEGGVAGLWLGLGPLDADQVRLLIPGVGGVELDADSKVADVSYYYPGSWGTTALIIQGQKGGVLVSADEPGCSLCCYAHHPAQDRLAHLAAYNGRCPLGRPHRVRLAQVAFHRISGRLAGCREPAEGQTARRLRPYPHR